MSTRLHRSCVAGAATLVLAVTSLGAAAGPAPAPLPPAATSPAPVPPRAVPSANVGKIVAIDPIRTRPKGTGVGAVAGGVVGGLIGNKVIGGTPATVIGAFGGAVAGNNLERNHREGVAGYHVRIRLDNGKSRTIDQTHVGTLHVGDRVRIDNGRVERV